jgi:pyruvate dehydrogenase E1 component alpha subunit
MIKSVGEANQKEQLSKEEMLSLYRLMLLIRRFEESTYRKYREGKIGGYLHRYDGQEALVAGIIPQLRKDDYILCTYRDHAHALACGTDPRHVMAELMGRATGCAHGKGGSMHLIDPDNGFYGGDGIVGGPVPIALGVGYAIKYRGGDQVCVCYFGDGAFNQGGVHESLNMAALYGIPVLFILENNKYAMGTGLERSTRQPDFLIKARAYGIEAERMDGMDVLEIHSRTREILSNIRRESKPYFIEMNAYRFLGHGVADNPQQQKFYRSESEIEEWKKRDPIYLLGRKLEKMGWLDDSEKERIEDSVKLEVEEAISYAERSPEPAPEALFEHVFG